MTSIETPMICGTYPAIASVGFDISAGEKNFPFLAPVVTKALEAAGLTVNVGYGHLTIAGRHEARLPAYRMDENIWNALITQGYGLASVTPVRVRNVFSGGQHSGRRARMYIYEELSLFVAKGEGSDTLMEKVRNFARENFYSNTPDFDQIVDRLKKPAFPSQRWAPLMDDTRDLVGKGLFIGQGVVPDITYFADSMVATIVDEKGLEYIPIPNADVSPRFVATWEELISS